MVPYIYMATPQPAARGTQENCSRRQGTALAYMDIIIYKFHIQNERGKNSESSREVRGWSVHCQYACFKGSGLVVLPFLVSSFLSCYFYFAVLLSGGGGGGAAPLSETSESSALALALLLFLVGGAKSGLMYLRTKQ